MALISKLRHVVQVNTFKVRNFTKVHYECPICNYSGPFLDTNPPTGLRTSAFCPNCYSAERHRLQKLVLNELFNNQDLSNKRMLHFAPEHFFQKYFKNKFQTYTTADLYRDDVDVKADLTNLPFNDAEYDFIFASHVLEHIKDDLTAISEIRRVLKPNGIAILPVPIVGVETIEYPQPNPLEADHVRAPGFDYYDRYHKYFQNVKKYSSSDFPTKYQPFVNEDRSNAPTKECPLRQPMAGEKHLEIVPICYV